MKIPTLKLSWLLTVVAVALAVGFTLAPQACTKSDRQNLSNPQPSDKNPAPTTQAALWQVVASNELASVQVCQQLYERGPQTPFFVRFRAVSYTHLTLPTKRIV